MVLCKSTQGAWGWELNHLFDDLSTWKKFVALFQKTVFGE